MGKIKAPCKGIFIDDETIKVNEDGALYAVGGKGTGDNTGGEHLGGVPNLGHYITLINMGTEEQPEYVVHHSDIPEGHLYESLLEAEYLNPASFGYIYNINTQPQREYIMNMQYVGRIIGLNSIHIDMGCTQLYTTYKNGQTEKKIILETFGFDIDIDDGISEVTHDIVTL